jgi:hypothetical protein
VITSSTVKKKISRVEDDLVFHVQKKKRSQSFDTQEPTKAMKCQTKNWGGTDIQRMQLRKKGMYNGWIVEEDDVQRAGCGRKGCPSADGYCEGITYNYMATWRYRKTVCM